MLIFKEKGCNKNTIFEASKIDNQLFAVLLSIPTSLAILDKFNNSPLYNKTEKRRNYGSSSSSKVSSFGFDICDWFNETEGLIVSCLSGWLELIDVEIWFEISCIVLTFWIGCWKEEVEGNWYVVLSDNTFSYRWELEDEETACCCNSFSNPIYK